MVEKKYLRHYPYKTLGAQLFGTLREISPDEVGTKRVPRRQPRDADRQGRDRGELRLLPARDRRLHARDRQLVRQPRRHAPHDAHGPDPGPPAAPDARPRAPARRPERGRARDRGGARQRQPGRRGRVRGDGPARRRGAGARLLPELRREPVRQADRPGDLRGAQQRGERRAAVQPRDRRRLSDRLDVQADHRARGGRRRHHHAEHAAVGPRRVPLRRARVQERGRRRVRHARAAARAPGLLRRVLLPARRGRQRARRDHPGVGAQAQLRPADGHRPAGRVRRPRAGREVAQLRVREVRQVREEGQGPDRDDRGAVRLRRHRARLERRRQRQPRRRPGRPAGDAAAARHRLRGDRQRRQGRHAAPRPADRGRRGPPARGDPQARQAAGRHRAGDARGDPQRPARRGGRGGRHVGRRLRRLPVHGLRQDGHGGARAEPRPVLVRRLRRRPGQADRRRGDDREGRLRRRGRRAGHAPDPVEVVRGQGRPSSTRGRARRDEPGYRFRLPARPLARAFGDVTVGPPREHRDPDQARLGTAAPARAARVAAAARSAAAARGGRAGRLLLHRDQGRDGRRRRRRPALLRRAPDRLRRDRRGADVRDLAAGLLAAARAQVRRLRLPDRLDRARLRPRHGDARIQALDRDPVHELPAVRAGQGPARRRARGLHRRPAARRRAAARPRRG